MNSQISELENNVGKIGIELITWENDADHYKCEIHWISLDQVELIKELLAKHKKERHSSQDWLGNFSEKDGYLLEDLVGYEYGYDRLRTVESYKFFKVKSIEVEEIC